MKIFYVTLCLDNYLNGNFFFRKVYRFTLWKTDTLLGKKLRLIMGQIICLKLARYVNIKYYCKNVF